MKAPPQNIASPISTDTKCTMALFIFENSISSNNPNEKAAIPVA